jgi:hypothetical protein
MPWRLALLTAKVNADDDSSDTIARRLIYCPAVVVDAALGVLVGRDVMGKTLSTLWTAFVCISRCICDPHPNFLQLVASEWT